MRAPPASWKAAWAAARIMSHSVAKAAHFARRLV
jgi:hypothetical protein